MWLIGLLITSLIISQFKPKISAVLDLVVAILILTFTVFSNYPGLFYGAISVLFFFNGVLFFVTGKPVAYYLR